MPNLKTKTGNSSYFDEYELEKKLNSASKITGNELFLMFLPNYLLETPLHYLLMNDEFDLFNKLVSQINEENKRELFDSLKGYLGKINEMCYFILENVCSYEKKAIEMNYFKLEYDGADEDLDKNTRNSIQIVQAILDEIKEVIFKEFDHDELLYKRRRVRKQKKESFPNEISKHDCVSTQSQSSEIPVS